MANFCTGTSRPMSGPFPSRSSKPPTWAGLYARLRETGRNDGAGLAPRTVRNAHRVLACALRDAVLWKVAGSNAAASVRMGRIEQAEIEILTAEQQARVMEELRGKPLCPIVVTALGTAMRRGELLGLKWSDIDLAQGLLKVDRTLEQTKEGIRVKPPKSKAGRRQISLPLFVVNELRAHWKAQQEERLKIGLGRDNDAFVFGPLSGEFPRPDVLTNKWFKVSKRLGLGVTFHALRHTHASQLIDAGIDILSLSRRMGHSKASITLDVYGHRFRKDEDRTVQALDAAFLSVRTENHSGIDR